MMLSHCNYIIIIYRTPVKNDLASSQNLHNPRDVEKMCATCAAIAYTPSSVMLLRPCVKYFHKITIIHFSRTIFDI